MAQKHERFGSSMDLEERILTGAVIVALLSTFFPWISGEWLGEESVSYSGFSFFTSFIGLAVFAINAFVLTITVSPILHGPHIVSKKNLEFLRFFLTSHATVLTLAALSVLMKISYDYTRLDLRYGMYCTFIGSLVAMFYSWWKWQEQRSNALKEVFHHPDDVQRMQSPETRTPGSFPPPPPPLKPEDHRMRP